MFRTREEIKESQRNSKVVDLEILSLVVAAGEKENGDTKPLNAVTARVGESQLCSSGHQELLPGTKRTNQARDDLGLNLAIANQEGTEGKGKNAIQFLPTNERRGSR